MQQHPWAVFTTLTYDDEHVPATLEKRAVQLFMKRIRKKVPVRFFASGEYGERTGRPHYHGILFGASPAHAGVIQDAWPKGYAYTVPVTAARIAYVAGYAQKKWGALSDPKEERVDYSTGEVYQYQPPFIQMSRRPGIGGAARKWVDSWRSYAVQNGQKMPVPRFLHEAWKQQASALDLEELEYEKYSHAVQRDHSKEALQAAEQIALAKHHLQSQRRKH